MILGRNPSGTRLRLASHGSGRIRPDVGDRGALDIILRILLYINSSLLDYVAVQRIRPIGSRTYRLIREAIHFFQTTSVIYGFVLAFISVSVVNIRCG